MRSSLSRRTPGFESHSRAVVLFPAPEWPRKRGRADGWTRKIELCAGRGNVSGPEATREKRGLAFREFEPIGPRNVEFDIAGLILCVAANQKRLVLRIERNGHTSDTPHAERKSANLDGQAGRPGQIRF